jgi:hypothetical protein
VPNAECAGAALVAGTRPNGVECSDDTECTGGICHPTFGVCGECRTEADCTGGATCGITSTAEAHLALWPVCVAPASVPAGDLCFVDAECATGRCVGFECGLCRDAADCGGGACVLLVATIADDEGVAPQEVAVGAHCAAGGVASGGACLEDADCASGACNGEPLGACQEGPGPEFLFTRRCTHDMECPSTVFNREPACVTVGIRGGVCQ